MPAVLFRVTACGRLSSFGRGGPYKDGPIDGRWDYRLNVGRSRLPLSVPNTLRILQELYNPNCLVTNQWCSGSCWIIGAFKPHYLGRSPQSDRQFVEVGIRSDDRKLSINAATAD